MLAFLSEWSTFGSWENHVVCPQGTLGAVFYYWSSGKAETLLQSDHSTQPHYLFLSLPSEQLASHSLTFWIS